MSGKQLARHDPEKTGTHGNHPAKTGTRVELRVGDERVGDVSQIRKQTSRDVVQIGD